MPTKNSLNSLLTVMNKKEEINYKNLSFFYAPNQDDPKVGNGASRTGETVKGQVVKIDAETSKSKKGKQRLTDAMRTQKPGVDAFGTLLRRLRQLVGYTYDRVGNFPKNQKLFVGLGNDVISRTNYCMELALTVTSYNTKVDKENVLREMSIKLKMLQELVNKCCHCHYITKQNREAWLRMLVEIDDMAIGMAMSFQNKNKNRKSDNG